MVLNVKKNKMADIFVRIFVLLSFYFVYIQCLSCNCNTAANLTEVRTGQKNVKTLLVLHPNTKVQFECFQQQQEGILSHHRTYKIDLFNKTYKVTSEDFLNSTKHNFTVEWRKEIFHTTNESAFFSFPSWDVRVHEVVVVENTNTEEENLRFQAKLTFLPSNILGLFANSSSDKEPNTTDDLQQSVKILHGVCNEDLVFIMDFIKKNASSIKLQYATFTSAPINITFLATLISDDRFEVAVTTSYMFLLSNGTLFFGEYDSHLKFVLLRKCEHFTNGTVQQIFYTPQCLLGDPSSNKFDMVVALRTNVISNENELFISSHPFESWTNIPTNADTLNNGTVVDVTYDHGRNNIIVLVKQNISSSNALYKNYVFSTQTGNIICPPLVINLDDTAYDSHLRLEQNKGILYLKNLSDQLIWSSIDGGCTFLIDVSLDTLAVKNIHFSCPRTLSFNIMNDVTFMKAVKTKETVWTKYGILLLRETSHYQKFFLNEGPIPVTNNPVINHVDLILTKINTTYFYLKALDQMFTWPPFWINTEILFPWKPFSCTLLSFYSDGTEILCKCNLTFGTILGNEYIVPKNAWLNTKYFSMETICTVTDFINSTALHWNIKSQNFTTNTLLTWNSVSESQYSPFGIGIIQEFHENNTTSILPLTSIDSELSAKNVCLHYRAKSFDQLLFQDSDYICPVTLNVHGINKTVIYLDVSDEIEITVTLNIFSRSVHYRVLQTNLIQVSFSRPKNLDIRTKYIKKRLTQELRILLKQKWANPAVNIMSISTKFYHSKCENVSHSIKVMSFCPPNKRLFFEYPNSITVDHLLIPNVKDSNDIPRVFNLPVNYQPPSPQGIGIPLTKNVYNADPSKELYKTAFLKNHDPPEFKQCKNKQYRESCNCNHRMKVSAKESESDCIEKVFRLFYREKVVPRIFLLENKTKTLFKYPLMLEEINNRVDFFLLDTVLFENVAQALLMDQNSSIELKGSGLYHFKVATVNTNISFCKLEIEFIVYVDGTPFPDPIVDVVGAATAFFFGFILLGLFLYQYYYTSDSHYSDLASRVLSVEKN